MSSFLISNEMSFSLIKEDFFQIFKECYCHFPEKLFPLLSRFGLSSIGKEVFIANSKNFVISSINSNFQQQFWAGKSLFANDITKFVNATIHIIDEIPLKYEDFRKLIIFRFSVEKDESGNMQTGIKVQNSFIPYDFNLKKEILEEYYELKNSSDIVNFLKFHKKIVYSMLIDIDIKKLVQTARELFDIKNDFEKLSIVCPVMNLNSKMIEEKSKKSTFNCF